MTDPIPVAADHVCRFFDRVFWSLIEEPDICELCSHYNEDDSTCSCPRQAEQKST